MSPKDYKLTFITFPSPKIPGPFTLGLAGDAQGSNALAFPFYGPVSLVILFLGNAEPVRRYWAVCLIPIMAGVVLYTMLMGNEKEPYWFFGLPALHYISIFPGDSIPNPEFGPFFGLIPVLKFWLGRIILLAGIGTFLAWQMQPITNAQNDAAWKPPKRSDFLLSNYSV